MRGVRSQCDEFDHGPRRRSSRGGASPAGRRSGPGRPSRAAPLGRSGRNPGAGPCPRERLSPPSGRSPGRTPGARRARRGTRGCRAGRSAVRCCRRHCRCRCRCGRGPPGRGAPSSPRRAGSPSGRHRTTRAGRGEPDPAGSRQPGAERTSPARPAPARRRPERARRRPPRGRPGTGPAATDAECAHVPRSGDGDPTGGDPRRLRAAARGLGTGSQHTRGTGGTAAPRPSPRRQASPAGPPTVSAVSTGPRRTPRS